MHPQAAGGSSRDRSESPALRRASSATSSRSRNGSAQAAEQGPRRSTSRAARGEAHGAFVSGMGVGMGMPVKRREGPGSAGGMAPRVSFGSTHAPPAQHAQHTAAVGLPRLERSSVESAGARLEASQTRSISGRRPEPMHTNRQLRQSESDNEGREVGRGRQRQRLLKSNLQPQQQNSTGLAFRKGGINAKQLMTWVRIWPSGDSNLLQAEKATLTRTLGIQARDFRILESQSTRQACAILCRDKCIIISMSYIRCVITSSYILLTPPEDDRSAVFLGKLKERVRQSHRPLARPEPRHKRGQTTALTATALKAMARANAGANAYVTNSSGGGAAPTSGGGSSGGGGPFTPQALGVRAQWSFRYPASNASSSSPQLHALPPAAAGAPAPAPRGRPLVQVQMTQKQPQQQGKGEQQPQPGRREQQQQQQQQQRQQQERREQQEKREQQAAYQAEAQHLQQQLQLREEEEGAQAMEMPFELKVMEICLDELATDVEQGTRDLEYSLKPAIDGLASSVRAENLDLLRKLKTRLVNLKSITQMMCDSLGELLEDDDDMFNMSLTAKEQRELDLLQRVSFAISEDSEEGNLSDDSHSSDHSVKVSQVEMLLETYVMHFDSMFDRLQDLMENVTDTEAVVNIKLDAHQNKLITVNVVSQGLAVMNYFSLGIFSFFAMNLTPPAPLGLFWGGGGSSPQGGYGADLPHFLSVVLPAILGAYCILISLLVFLYLRGVLRF